MPLEKEAESVPGKVLTLVPPPAQPAPEPSVVEALTELLEDAKAGKVVSVAYMALYRRKEGFRGYAGLTDSSVIEALGMLDVLAHEIRSEFFCNND